MIAIYMHLLIHAVNNDTNSAMIGVIKSLLAINRHAGAISVSL